MKRKVFLEEPQEGHYKVHVVSDIGDLIRLNNLEKKEIRKGFSKKKTMRKIGSIPLDALMSLPFEKAIEIMSDDRAMKKFLKENPQYRTSEGRI